MIQNRQEDFLIISCERDISEFIEHDDILKMFTKKSSVLIKNLL